MNFNGTYYYYVRNGQGDIVKLIDANGNSVVEYTYDTWGKQTGCRESLAATLGVLNPFRYRGYVFDEETGLYYLNSRYYDPETGRFINPDIYISTGQGLLGHNMFAYCANNPVSRVDDEGDFWNFIVGAILGASANVVSQIASNLINRNNVLDGVAVAAVTGAASGVLAASGASLAVSVFGNALISVAGNVTNQIDKIQDGGTLQLADAIQDGVIGALSGAAGGPGMGKSVNLSTLNKNLTRKFFTGIKEFIKGARYYYKQTYFAYKNILWESIKKSTPVNFLGQLGKRMLLK